MSMLLYRVSLKNVCSTHECTAIIFFGDYSGTPSAISGISFDVIFDTPCIITLKISSPMQNLSKLKYLLIIDFKLMWRNLSVIMSLQKGHESEEKWKKNSHSKHEADPTSKIPQKVFETLTINLFASKI